ncbi:MAG TPA: 30S ribosomal protein S8 [Vicinamibacterales bacterium]|jgi:small subunit ribosomal protein S8|nr:30S ribosomal protein S8 [Vicinamibacterales bacterium]
MTDPIADMLSRIRNATTARHARVEMPSSRLKVEIARILESEGYIQGFKVVDAQAGERPQAQLRVILKYGPKGERVITGLERVSRPGRRVYFSRDEVPDVLAGLGTSILTTSRGVMTGREAVRSGVGGEVLCNVW